MRTSNRRRHARILLLALAIRLVDSSETPSSDDACQGSPVDIAVEVDASWPAKGAPLSLQTTGTQPPLGGETVKIAYW